VYSKGGVRVRGFPRHARRGSPSILSLWVLGLALTSIASAERVGWWKMDEGSGAIAFDSSGCGNVLSLKGDPRWVAGHVEGGLEFDGLNDYLDRGVYAPRLDIVGELTVTAWVKPGATLRDYKICGNVTAGPNGGGYMMGIYSNDNVELEVRSSAGTSAQANRPGGGTGLLKGTWYFLAATYSETADGGVIRTYVNSVFDREEITTIVMARSSQTFKIGRDPGTPGGGQFEGVVDDVQVFDQVLLEDDLLDVMRGKGPKSEKATGPRPEGGHVDAPRDVTLVWTPGMYAQTHDVYFGTSFEDVNTASRTNPLGVLVSQGQDANAYDPAGLLAFGQTYYWRVDEVNAPPDSAIHEGSVWSFTAEPLTYAVQNIGATASGSDPGAGPENTVNGSGLENDLHSTHTGSMWLSNSRPAWIQFDFARLYGLTEMWVWNHNSSLERAFGLGAKDVTIEYSTDGSAWATLAGVSQFAQASGVPDYAHNTTVDFGGVVARHVKITITSNWGGLAQKCGLSEVRFFQIPMYARQPQPASGATGVAVDAVLGWRAGREAARHEVYFGSDPNAVREATTPILTVTEPRCGLGALAPEYGRTYYWKVNEVNDAASPTSWNGDVWSFSVPVYGVVDDFESYDDRCNRVYYAWKSGAGNGANEACGVSAYEGNGTGSIVGHDPPGPYAEIAIVHGGLQSMPFFYDGTAGAAVSEAERTFIMAQDWTQGGAKTLVLYFCGDPGNAAGQLYVKVNGAKVRYAGDASAITRPYWTQWNIDLASVSGVDLKAVTKVAIGVEGTSGKGIVYADDLLLYREAPPVPTEQIWIEAEATTTITVPLEVFSDRLDASGGQYMTSVDAGQSRSAGPGTDGTGLATYQFTVQGGTYMIRAREIVPAATADSWWVRIQGATLNTKIHASGWIQWNNAPIKQSWAWNSIYSSDDGGKTVLFTMPAGTYTLEMAYREDGCLVDALMVVKVE